MFAGPYQFLILLYGAFLFTVLLSNVLAKVITALIKRSTRRRYGSR